MTTDSKMAGRDRTGPRTASWAFVDEGELSDTISRRHLDDADAVFLDTERPLDDEIRRVR